jgi:hypothetical protein
MHSTKTKRIISGVIIALLIVAMVLPMVIATF